MDAAERLIHTLGAARLPALVLCLGFALAWLPLEPAIALLGGVGLAIATLVHPEWGIYVLIFAVPFGSLRNFHIASYQMTLSEVCVALVLVSWLARMVLDRQIVVPQLPLLIPLLAYISVLALSWLAAFSLSAALKETIKWVEVALTYLFVGSRFHTGHVRKVTALILLAGLAEGLLGAYQFFGRVGPEGFLWATPVGLFMRAYGTFDQPNPFGGYLGLVAPLAYALWLTSFEHFRDRRTFWLTLTQSTVFGIITAFLALVILMTWSRGAQIGFLAAFVLMNMVRSRRAAAIFLAIAFVFAALGAIRMLPAVFTQRFADFWPFLSVPDIARIEVNPTNFAIVQRLAHWIAAWGMFVDHPWLGVGIGNYAAAYSQYTVPAWPDPLGHAHNYYLNLAGEVGLVGLMAYVLLWGVAFWQALSGLRMEDHFNRAIALGVFGVLVHLSVHNFVDNLFVHNMYLHVAILLGCLTALGRQARVSVSTSKALERAFFGQGRGQAIVVQGEST